VSGTSTSYIYLMATRILLGAVTAAAWPCVASLTGDFFPARERAGIYGLILSGELIGAGVGFFISGEVSSVLSWRWSFYVMGAVSLGIWWLVWHHLPEPERGTQSWIELGARDPEAASRSGGREQDGSETSTESGLARETAREADVQPRRQLVLHEDPTRRSWWWTMRYLMHIPTYPLLIAASALAYYFFSGARAFAMIYFTEHYDLARSVVSALVIVVGIGAIAGVVAGGQMSEWLLRKGHLTVRIVLPAIALFVAVLFLGYGVWTPSVWIGITMLTIGAGALAAAVAPIDAARLDIIHPRMWGRAEAGRMALRAAFEGSAPLLFGAVSGWLGGGAEGLKWTFLIMLTPALAASLLAIPARRTYPRDVATAAASVEATSKRKGQNRSSG